LKVCLYSFLQCLSRLLDVVFLLFHPFELVVLVQ
jgi:hypothetical protein